MRQITEDEIYKRADEVMELLKDLSINQREMVLSYAMRTDLINGLIEELKPEGT